MLFILSCQISRNYVSSLSTTISSLLPGEVVNHEQNKSDFRSSQADIESVYDLCDPFMGSWLR